MHLERKALYNLLFLNRTYLQQTDEKFEPWQLEDYRKRSNESLFNALQTLGILSERSDFENIARNYETPEALAEALSKEAPPRESDFIYLLVFEIWRRQFPELKTISIFCDELDYQIVLYDEGKIPASIELQDALAYLQYILDENVDQGVAPREAFELIQTNTANDIESFLYDYISEAIDAKATVYASEVLEGFYRYMKDKFWFDLLSARVAIHKDSEEGYQKLEKLISLLEKTPNPQLNLEILSFLATKGNHLLFVDFAHKTLPHLKNEEEFQDLLFSCCDHFIHIELEKEKEKYDQILENRANNNLSNPISSSDPDLKIVQKQLKNLKRFKV